MGANSNNVSQPGSASMLVLRGMHVLSATSTRISTHPTGVADGGSMCSALATTRVKRSTAHAEGCTPKQHTQAIQNPKTPNPEGVLRQQEPGGTQINHARDGVKEHRNVTKFGRSQDDNSKRMEVQRARTSCTGMYTRSPSAPNRY